jgi:hypothetical protein
MLRLACIAVTEAGIDVCAPVHDALLIEAKADEIDDSVACVRYWMQRASEQVLGTRRVCRTEVKIIRPGERYSDPRGALMFDRVRGLLRDPSKNLADGLPDGHRSPPNSEPINEPVAGLVA